LGAIFLIGLLFVTTAGDTGVQTRAMGCLSNMRQLTRAWQLYAADNRDFYPPNVNDFGRNWVAGPVDDPTREAVTGARLVDGRYSALGPYSRDPVLYRCPADPSTLRFGGTSVPRPRSCSANQAVGTKSDGFSPADGPWLDGAFGHTANRTWYTYGKVTDVIRPSPSRLWILIDEDEFSINDGGFGLSMRQPGEWIDWPATRHDTGATIAFADGSAEMHRWKDSRTPVRNGNVNRRSVPGSVDLLWLQERTTTLVGGNRP
jgi:prepilin-type processing-associated H-X9-DG protein